ncbi:hypothetical protein bcgnr5372_38550 [Bacillus luti]|nr:hypothetical protein [Bacillus cereus]HDR8327237.1 hypothetical protein [Bacillus cereus]HDR8336427.1 hypothetical protein [Bacillus cereus]
MIIDDTNVMLGALAFLFFMIYLGTNPRDVSLLLIPACFGGTLVSNWLTENGYQGTYVYTVWIAVYSMIMIYLIIVSIRLGINNVKYIKERRKKRRAIRK